MILHLLRMRRNVNRNVFNDRKNVSGTPERMFKIIYSSPYGSNETATSSHVVKGTQKGKVTCYARERVNKNKLF